MSDKLTEYRVTILHDACTTHDVRAADESEAVAKAFNDCGVNLCHHCAHEIELADPIRAVCVENLDTGVTNDDVDPDHEVVALRKAIAEKDAEIARLRGIVPEALEKLNDGLCAENERLRQEVSQLHNERGQSLHLMACLRGIWQWLDEQKAKA